MNKYNRQSPCIYHYIKVVFHGIPKNASTSIKNALYEQNWGKPFEGNKQWIHKGNEKGGSIYPSLVMIRSKKYSIYTHFTVVRNPYDRFLSFYNDLFAKTTNLRTNIPPFYVDNNITLEPKPINEVLDIIEQFNDDECDEHFASQCSFIHSDNVFVIKQEHLNQGWKTLCHKLQIDHKELKQFNQSKNYSNLTEDQKDRIFKRYKNDFERFEYER